MATAMTATPAWEVWGATAGQGGGRGQPAARCLPCTRCEAHHGGYSPVPKWKT